MPQSFPEGFNNSRGDTALPEEPTRTTEDIVVRGLDAASIPVIPNSSIESYTPTPSEYVMSTEYFVPEEDRARGLLLHQVADLAVVATVNFPQYEAQRARVIASVRGSIIDGSLALDDGYAEMNVDQQAERFVATSVGTLARPAEEVVQGLQIEREKLGVIKRANTEHENEVAALREQIRKQGLRMLEVRAKLVEGGATEEFLREFDYTTKLMAKPEQEVYEQEMQLNPDYEAPLVDTGEIRHYSEFKHTLEGNDFATEATQHVGVHALHSAEVTVVSEVVA